MAASTKILVFARPGHSRDSLVALLRTLPQVELTLIEGNVQLRLELMARISPDILLVDLDSYANPALETLTQLKKTWPGAQRIFLTDHFYPNPIDPSREVDCFLTKSTPAGEFLQVIRQLIDRGYTNRLASFRYKYPPVIENLVVER